MFSLISRFKAPRPAGIGLALVAALVLAGLTAGRALAAVASQLGDDVTAWPLVAAVLSLLLVSGVASAITAVLRKVGDAGIPPKSVLYAVCAVIVTVAFVAGGGALPLVDFADPAGTVAAWVLFVGSLGKFTEAFYDIALVRVLPDPAPPTPA